ncbi:MAG: hypothetical protein GOV02_03130 [Candidatus Aenigmarchaeota archaeon]|nr:hypothetical protein [Candidatus Aenigmarchaeota archaeon]
MAVRDDLYRKFGPKLIEALALVIMDEINILRAQHALPDRTANDIVTAIENKIGPVTSYDWMDS